MAPGGFGCSLRLMVFPLMRKHHWIMLTLLFAGCATVRTSSLPASAPPRPDEAVVYLIHDMPTIGAAAVYIDGVRMITLGGREYTWFYRDPGECRISFVPLDSVTWQQRLAADSTFDLKAGKTYFVSVSWYENPPDESPLQILLAPWIAPRFIEPTGITLYDEPTAKAAIKVCRHVDPVR